MGISALAELVALDQIAPLYHLIADGTVRLVLDAIAALGVEEMECHPLRDGGGIKPDGNRHQSERYGAGSKRASSHSHGPRFVWLGAIRVPPGDGQLYRVRRCRPRVGDVDRVQDR